MHFLISELHDDGHRKQFFVYSVGNERKKKQVSAGIIKMSSEQNRETAAVTVKFWYSVFSFFDI